MQQFHTLVALSKGIERERERERELSEKERKRYIRSAAETRTSKFCLFCVPLHLQTRNEVGHLSKVCLFELADSIRLQTQSWKWKRGAGLMNCERVVRPSFSHCSPS